MAKKKLKHEKQFKPGNRGGPGRPRLDPELKEYQTLPKDAFKHAIGRFMNMSVDELQDFIVNIRANKSSVFESYMAIVIAEGLKRKDHGVFEWLAQRSVGKMTEQIDVTHDMHSKLMEFIQQRRLLMGE